MRRNRSRFSISLRREERTDGGGQRIHGLDLLLKRLEEYHLPREAFDWYIDLRKYGSVTHAGFGMGVERSTAWMCGLEDIRETIAFPRMLYRTRP